jgi:iron complex outermembrane receptor protein
LEQPGASAADVLRELPGLTVFDLGGFGAPATASIRGATAAQTPVYFGGVRLNDEVGGTANLSDIPIASIERVEVYRSHAPLLADQLGLGGAIFFEPRRALQDELRLSALVGSYGSRSAGGSISLNTSEASAIAGFELSAANNDYLFSSQRGTLFDPSDDGSSERPNADAAMKSWFLLANRSLGPARLALFYQHADREQGAPKLALTPSESARVAFGRDLFALRTQIPVPGWAGSVRLVTQAVLGATTIDDPRAELGLQFPRVVTRGERVEQSAIGNQVFDGLKLVEHVSVATEQLRRLELQGGSLKQALFAERFAARAASSAELALLGPLFAEATLSWSFRGTQATEFASRFAHEPSGRLGLSLRTLAFELYASIGRYQRVPTLSELYGASLLTRGNPGLDVESGTSLEAGARQQLFEADGRRLLWLEAAAFSRFSEKLVKYARTAQGYLFPVNLSRSRTLGGELSAGAEPFGCLSLLLSLSLLDPRDTSENRQTRNDFLPFSSQLSASGLVNLHSELELGAIDSASVGLRAVYSSSRYADFAGIEVIPEQGSLNLEAALGFLEKRLLARARAANLFDARSFDVVGFPLPGRSIFLSMEAKL